MEDKKYIVSFIGFAPLDNPQVVVYVVVDEPNAEYQADSKYAQYLYKKIMTEILPYLNIFPDQELTGKESGAMLYLENEIVVNAEKNRQKAERLKREAEEAGTQEPGTQEPEDGTPTPEADEGNSGITVPDDGIQEGTDDPNVPEPEENDEELKLDNKQESDGITNEEANLGSGN